MWTESVKPITCLKRPTITRLVSGILSVIAFHEKAGRSQEGSFVFRWPRIFSRRVATVATLPSALWVSDFRSVPVGCSRFSRCCHLFIDLRFHPQDGSWARRLTQSPELGVLSFVFSFP